MEPLKSLSNLKEYNLLLDEEVKKATKIYHQRKRWEDKQQDMLDEWNQLDIERKQYPYPMTKDPRFTDMTTLYYCHNMSSVIRLRFAYGIMALCILIWGAHL